MIWFVVTAVITYLIYYLFIVRRYDEKGKLILRGKTLKKGSPKRKEVLKYPAEVELFIYKYKIDIKKLNFRGLLKLLGFVCSLDVAFIVTVLNLLKINNPYILLGIGALMVIPVILISFGILGKYFKKKGWTKNV